MPVRWLFIFTGILLKTTASPLFSQSPLMIVNGSVYSDSLLPLSNASVKILNKAKRTIVYYTQTGASNTFKTSLKTTEADTLVAIVSHTGYLDDTLLLIPVQKDTILIARFVLQKNIRQLEGVTINAPPQWKRGDTTFFKADSFKTGGEKKLIDLITKLPGFSITRHGTLTFNNKVVEKIMLDGEELFSDKIQLLLQNLPVNAINIIEALENQLENPILRGLAPGNKVHVNLSLKKNKNRILFGDAEAGISSNKNYKLSQTLFSLVGKFNYGLINNLSSTGNTYARLDEYQYLPEPLKANQVKMIPADRLFYIPEFPETRYFSNKLIESQAQFNFNYSRKIKSQTEISLLKDNIPQTVIYHSELLDNGVYFTRDETSMNRYQPLIIALQKRISCRIDSTTELQVRFRGYLNQSGSYSSSGYTNGASSFGESSRLNNRWKYYTSSLSFGKRLFADRALLISIDYSRNNLLQQGLSYSDMWSQLYPGLPAGYDALRYDLRNNISVYKAAFEYYTRIKGKLKVLKLTADKTLSYINSDNHFQNSDLQLPLLKNPEFSGSGRFSVSKVYASYSLTGKILRREYTLLTDIGFAGTKTKESFTSHRIKPYLGINLSGKRAYSSWINDEITVNSVTKPLAVYQLNSGFFPSALNEFYLNRPGRNLITRIISSYRLSAHLKNFTHTSVSLTAITDLNGTAYNPAYQLFLLKREDSITGRGSWIFSANPEIGFPSAFLKAKVRVGLTYTHTAGFFFVNDLLLISRSSTRAFMLEISRKWKKENSLSLTMQLNNSTSKTNTLTAASRFTTTNLLSKLSLWHRLMKNITAAYLLQIYHNNAFSSNRHTYLLSDLALNYFVPAKRIGIELTFTNITNETAFYNIAANSGQSRTFFSLPLIKRNILLGVRWEF